MSHRLSIDLFWSFRSPWSYLATPRLADWAERYELDVRFRPVYPIAIRTPEFFASVHPQWFGYLMTDVFRVAEFLGLPFVWPSPDPVVSESNREGRPSFPEERVGDSHSPELLPGTRGCSCSTSPCIPWTCIFATSWRSWCDGSGRSGG